ncbi:hypothetical protein DESUT3_01490 [Desulfuromonas versatilis]|uniref:PD-(D/E)XK endonuclease-like domain-containing protein n=2 Tax=Desulfuromonas versatilis TaxID=2802975 RepID=A0ABN6DS89_9BACT|nr:hypothetical protein DESUT3_01490 [Desulfuromonas versatilis]
MRDGIGAAFEFERPDGLRIRLAHEPSFSTASNPKAGKIYSWTTTQEPDIFLEASFPSGDRIHWVFDAKYRIEDAEESLDLIPEEAINQMHRYRDALIYLSEADDGTLEKSRPVVGAFVLYPGWFDDGEKENPYTGAIDAVGIGGFPLLPGANNLWLESFLRERLGDLSGMEKPYPEASPDIHYLREPVRIYSTGLAGGHYQDLTLVAQPKNHNKEYINRFRSGGPRWYHVPVDTTVKKQISRAMMREIRNCAFAVHHPGEPNRRIEYLYDVLSVKVVKRKELTHEQAGLVKPGDESDYWLLELGSSRCLQSPVIVPGLRGFRFRLTGAKELLMAADWGELPVRYALDRFF